MGMSEQLSMMPTPTNEDERRRVLRKHKIAVTSLLGLMAVVFLACSWWQSVERAPAWVGYVRAAAEAGMVGALADWFAVTALFRHPLGLPIPHTAIIKRKKDQVGHALSEFVGDNFLNATLITEKLRQARIPERAADWVLDGGGAERTGVERHDVALVLGSGWGEAAGLIGEEVAAVPLVVQETAPKIADA